MTDRAEQTSPPSYPAPPDWPGPSDPGTPAGRPWGRWLIIGTVVWAVLLVGLSYLSMRRDEPTVREQRTLTQAQPVVSRAIGELVRAAGTEAVLELVEPRLTSGCRVTTFRDGATLERDLIVRTTPDRVDPLLATIADRLPAGYRAGIRPDRDGNGNGGNGDGGNGNGGGGGPTLRADAGDFVAVSGRSTGPGVLRFTATTGCRPVEPDLALADLLPGLGVDDQPGQVLAALGASEVAPAGRVSVACPGGGQAHTARATGVAAPAAPSPAEILPDPDGPVAAANPELYAFRDGPRSIVIESVDGDLRAAVTTDCA
ncbi:hypothetical protein O7627_30750 [Solwaraspora sp. WMMD1047]|uniref:hypothetical protein n=1 Tax=Solwaraspora sp. WMMD1047 TaxID=3016102 RepID=UPI002417CF5A|nr:hypothetical protein [Solwaraspora sp. WMMD1047]MDG4833657.1 hypothetical protein [Solwaraspora sp. WMMD1047]